MKKYEYDKIINIIDENTTLMYVTSNVKKTFIAEDNIKVIKERLKELLNGR